MSEGWQRWPRPLIHRWKEGASRKLDSKIRKCGHIEGCPEDHEGCRAENCENPGCCWRDYTLHGPVALCRYHAADYDGYPFKPNLDVPSLTKDEVAAIRKRIFGHTSPDAHATVDASVAIGSD